MGLLLSMQNNAADAESDGSQCLNPDCLIKSPVTNHEKPLCFLQYILINGSTLYKNSSFTNMQALTGIRRQNPCK